jgi:type II secretion system protein J
VKKNTPQSFPLRGLGVTGVQPRSGFTLVELLVATSIFVIVLAAAYSLFESGRNLASRAELRAQMYQTARAAIKAVEEDLKGAVMPGAAYDTGFIGTDGGGSDKPLDKVELIAVNAHTMVPTLKTDVAQLAVRKADLSKVTFWVEGDSSRPAHGLVRHRQPVLNPVTVQNLRDEDIEEVAADVVYLNLRYYDSDWKDSWDSTQNRKLPKAIELTLHVRGEWRGKEFREKFMTRFFLPVAAETPERQP